MRAVALALPVRLECSLSVDGGEAGRQPLA